MYSIYADDVCIYNDVFAVESVKAIDPKLTLEDNAAGSLTMTLPPVNAGYNTIVELITNISVQKDGKEVWAGRVLSEEKDFWNNRILYCEGELAFFNDTSQPPAEYVGLSIRAYLETLIQIHNSKVAANRRFTIGAVTVVDSKFPTYHTNNEKTMALINGLVEEYGGHLIVRKVNGTRYLDYMSEYPDTSSQTIQFGKNLIDFTRNWDKSEFATVLVPLGKRLDESPIEALDAYLTVESVNNGSMYIQSNEAVAAYGWIDKVVTWNDVSDPAILLEKGKEYLSEIQFDNMEIELTALDLHHIDPTCEPFKLLDEVEVISLPHGLDRVFPVTKMEILLDSPEKTRFTLGNTVKTSLTSVNNQINTAIWDKIDNLPKAHSILKQAKENATEIMNRATTGYITIVQDEYGSETLYISNTRDYTKASKLWKWNMNGLGYSNDGGKTYGLAITMDGSIVADYITTGVLNADVIRAGTLKDYGNNFILDLDTGKLTMKKGSINIGNGNFIVDEEGNITIKKGSINIGNGNFVVDSTGKMTALKGTFKDVVQASDFLDSSGNSMMSGAKFASDYLDLKGITITDSAGKVSFKVEKNGNVTIGGTITGSLNWASITNTNIDYNPAYSLASSANTKAANAQADVDSLRRTVNGLNIPVLPDYIKSTYIDKTRIESPTITGNNIVAREYFRVAPTDYATYGYMGLAYGMDADGYLTYGVALSSNVPDGLSTNSCYVIVTNRGVRLQAPNNHRITVTSTGCRADGVLIGGGTAVWG